MDGVDSRAADGQAVDGRASDGRAAIAWNVEALKRIVLSLVALAGAGALPRHLHRALLRLVRPAEAAARRLIIAAALGVTVPAWRGPAQRIVKRPVRAFQPKMPVEPAARPPLRHLALPLADPARRAPRSARAKPSGIPRLWFQDMTLPRVKGPVRLPPRPSDRLDAARLRLRLGALDSALIDLPGQALRFARWQARQAFWRKRGVARRWPLRPGPPPGSARPSGRPLVHGVSSHEMQAVLANAHELGWWALQQRRDTS